MTTDEFFQALKLAQTADEDGWKVLPESLLTVHLSRAGVGLNVTRIERFRVDGSMLQLKNQKGELSVVLVEDVFAISLDGSQSAGRKAGFVS